MLGFELLTGCAIRMSGEVKVLDIFKRATYNQ